MKKLLLYGMGKVAEKFVRQLQNVSLYKILAVTSSSVEVSEGEFMSIPVLKPKEWSEIECDYVIIASTKYEAEIRQEIEACHPKCKAVFSIAEFYYNAVVRFEGEKLANNELYQFMLKKEHRKFQKLTRYYRVYDRYFSKYRGKEIVFLEIGINNGGSLQMWKQYFGDKATIIGVDINEECKNFEEDNIKIEIGSQDDVEFWEYIKKKYPRIDIILDDGGHTMKQQIATFESMFSHISDGGIYLCEDTCTSYWKEFDGGYKKENTFIEYSKDFVDDIYAKYMRDNEIKSNYNSENIYAIHYYDSMVVLEKELAEDLSVIIMEDGEIVSVLDWSRYQLSKSFQEYDEMWKSE